MFGTMGNKRHDFFKPNLFIQIFPENRRCRDPVHIVIPMNDDSSILRYCGRDPGCNIIQNIR